MLLQLINEHIIAKNYGWTLDYIDTVDISRLQIHTRLCLVTENIEMEHKIKLAGGEIGGTKSKVKTTRGGKQMKTETIKLNKVLTKEDLI